MSWIAFLNSFRTQKPYTAQFSLVYLYYMHSRIEKSSKMLSLSLYVCKCVCFDCKTFGRKWLLSNLGCASFCFKTNFHIKIGVVCSKFLCGNKLYSFIRYIKYSKLILVFFCFTCPTGSTYILWLNGTNDMNVIRCYILIIM